MWPVTFEEPAVEYKSYKFCTGGVVCSFCFRTVNNVGFDVSDDVDDGWSTFCAVLNLRSKLDNLLLRRVFEFSSFDFSFREKTEEDIWIWCVHCNRVHSLCCLKRNARDPHYGCDEVWAKFPIGYRLDGRKYDGSIVVTPNRLREFFVCVVTGTLELETFCFCPGTCIQGQKRKCCRSAVGETHAWPLIHR